MGKNPREERDEIRMAGKKRQRIEWMSVRLFARLLAWMPFDIFMRIGHLKDKCEPTNQDNGNILK